jgi:hypothetical protein
MYKGFLHVKSGFIEVSGMRWTNESSRALDDEEAAG